MNGSFLKDDDRGFLKEGVETYLILPVSPLDSPTFFLSSHSIVYGSASFWFIHFLSFLHWISCCLSRMRGKCVTMSRKVSSGCREVVTDAFSAVVSRLAKFLLRLSNAFSSPVTATLTLWLLCPAEPRGLSSLGMTSSVHYENRGSLFFSKPKRGVPFMFILFFFYLSSVTTCDDDRIPWLASNECCQVIIQRAFPWPLCRLSRAVGKTRSCQYYAWRPFVDYQKVVNGVPRISISTALLTAFEYWWICSNFSTKIFRKRMHFFFFFFFLPILSLEFSPQKYYRFVVEDLYWSTVLDIGHKKYYSSEEFLEFWSQKGSDFFSWRN